jgi:four helix bundle protein
MKYERFEDLPVWQAGMTLTERIFRLTENKSFSYKGDLRSQLQRAALSVPNNIAEGFERGTTSELLAFLYIARGSAGEVRSMCRFFERRPRLQDLKPQISNLISVAESCSRQLRAWTDSLQDSDIAGPRHLNEKSRSDYRKRKAREDGEAAFRQMLAQSLPPDHPLHPNNRPA